MLRIEGHEVVVAHDGLKTLEAVAAMHPDVVLLDIGLPKVNGYEVARRIRAMSGMQDCLLVAITGWGQPRDRQLAREAGFDEHLVKPVEPETLLRLSARGRGAGASADATAATVATRGQSRAAPAPAAPAPSAAAQERVLVVNDNDAVQASAADLLRSAGFDVKTVGDGKAALECAGDWGPRYVLIDINMPIMNGFELGRRLRAQYSAHEMKLILMSGVSLTAAVRGSARSAGFDACIDKMAEPEQWSEVLRLG